MVGPDRGSTFAPNDVVAMNAGVRAIAVDRGGRCWTGQTTSPRWPTRSGSTVSLCSGSPSEGPTRACAYALPDRVARAGLVSCLGPIDDPTARRRMSAATRYGLAAARISPLLARPMVALTARQARGGKMIDQLATSMAPPDAEVLRRQDVLDGLGRSLAESFRQAICARLGAGLGDHRPSCDVLPRRRGRRLRRWSAAMPRSSRVS